jgi:hypothetical protein
MASHDDDHDDHEQGQAAEASVASSESAAPTHGREVTGRELIAAAKRGDSDVQAMLDPSTAAELAKWFGLPSFSELAERGEAPPSAEPSSSENALFAEQLKAREAAMSAAQPAFLDSIERWHLRNAQVRHDDSTAERALEKFAHVTTVIEQFAHRMVVQLPTDRERPYDLDDAVRTCTPQALLRDLFRPAEVFPRYLQLESTREPVFEHKPKVSTYFHMPVAQSFTSGFAELRESLTLIRELHATNWAELDLPNRKNIPEEEASL